MSASPSQESLKVAFRQGRGAWHNEELFQQLLSENTDEQGENNWFLARWRPTPPEFGGLSIRILVPTREFESDTLHHLLSDIHSKLVNGLGVASAEKGWPTPRFSLQAFHQDEEESWAYQLVLNPFQTDTFELHPNKILAVGEEITLGSMLGLETTDPILGLPAKWVTFGQAERASDTGALLFKTSEVVMGHAINFLSARSELAVGFWELNLWLTKALSNAGPAASKMIAEHNGFLLRVIRNLMQEQLHLPPTERFIEYVCLALSETPNDFACAEQCIRRDVINDNLSRWQDGDGYLCAFEWVGPAELRSDDHQRMLERLENALEEMYHSTLPGPVILTNDAEGRKALATALGSPYPKFPVLSWSDLKDLGNVRILYSINANLPVDPPAPPTALFTISSV